MAESEVKVGIIACSGEDLAGGTLSRLATRKILDERRPHHTVTICLPLFLAGGQEERMFAKAFPTITVDGCEKRCAYKATERLSGKVNASIVVSDIVGAEAACGCPLATDALNEDQQRMVELIADAIEAAFDKAQGTRKAARIVD